MHLADLQAAVTNVRDFEAAELKANHAQAVNLVINKSSELDSKLKQFSDFINQKLEGHILHHHLISCGSKRHISATTVVSNSELSIKLSNISTNLPANNATANISTTHILTSSLSTTAANNILTTAATNNLSDTCNANTIIKSSSNDIREL
ncbi:hypothetical protein G9A89_014381 [Geosiphon pyriformis]|nr:hypothetical protein G9A89_014381 [Geosiphon pyriformis]